MRRFIPGLLFTCLTLGGPIAGHALADKLDGGCPGKEDDKKGFTKDDPAEGQQKKFVKEDGDAPKDKKLVKEGEGDAKEGQKKFVRKGDGEEKHGEKKFEKKPVSAEEIERVNKEKAERKHAKEFGEGEKPVKKFDGDVVKKRESAGDDDAAHAEKREAMERALGEKTEHQMAELRERRERDLAQLKEAEQKIREAYEIRERVLRGQAEQERGAAEKGKYLQRAEGERAFDKKQKPETEGDRPSEKHAKRPAKGEPEGRSGRDIEREALMQQAKDLQQKMMGEQQRHEAAMRELQELHKSLEMRARSLREE